MATTLTMPLTECEIHLRGLLRQPWMKHLLLIYTLCMS